MPTLFQTITEKINDLRFAKQVENDPFSIVGIKHPSEDLVISAIKGNYEVFPQIKSPSQKICELAVRENPWYLKIVPPEFITEQMCQLAVANDPWSFAVVPDGFKTSDMCDIAINQDGSMLEFVPVELQSPERCLNAIENNPEAFLFVKIDNEKVNIAAINANPEFIHYMKDPSENLKIGAAFLDPSVLKELGELSEKSYEQLCGTDSSYLKYVPDKFKTAEMCIEAYSHNKSYIQYFPEKMETEELWIDAIKENPKLVANHTNPTDKMILTALNQDGSLLKEIYPKTQLDQSNIPEKFRVLNSISNGNILSLTRNVATQYAMDNQYIQFYQIRHDVEIERQADNYFSIEQLRDREKQVVEQIQLIAAKAKMEFAHVAPATLDIKQKEEYCLAAVKNNPAAIQFVVNPTDKVIEQGLIHSPYVALFAGKESNSPQIQQACDWILNDNPSLIRYVDDKFKSPETSYAAVKENWYNLNYIPKELLSEKILIEGIKQSSGADKFVPDEMRNNSDILSAMEQRENLSPEINVENLTAQDIKYLERINDGERLETVFQDVSLKERKSFIEKVDIKGNMSEAFAYYDANKQAKANEDYAEMDHNNKYGSHFENEFREQVKELFSGMIPNGADKSIAIETPAKMDFGI